jgi:hypothetical protein
MKALSAHWRYVFLLAGLLLGCAFGPKHPWAYIGSLEPAVSAGGLRDEPHLIVGVPNGKMDFNWHGPSLYRHADYFEIYYRQPSNDSSLKIVRVKFRSIQKTEEIFVSDRSTLSIADCIAKVELLLKDESPISSVNGHYDMSLYGCKRK